MFSSATLLGWRLSDVGRHVAISSEVCFVENRVPLYIDGKQQLPWRLRARKTVAGVWAGQGAKAEAPPVFFRVH